MFPILAATAIATPENVTDPAPKTEKREDTHSSESLVEILVLSGKTHEKTYRFAKKLMDSTKDWLHEGFTRVTNGDMDPNPDFLWRSSPKTPAGAASCANHRLVEI